MLILGIAGFSAPSTHAINQTRQKVHFLRHIVWQDRTSVQL